MTTAWHETPRPADLAALVDAIADRSGCWLVVERFGQVLCHGAGAAACPAPLAAAVLSKRTTALRSAVMWSGRGALLEGSLDGLCVTAAELGDGATAWFVGGQCGQADVEAVSASLLSEGLPLSDPWIGDLLHRRGIRRSGDAPSARLVVLQGGTTVTALAAAAWQTVAGTAVRVHVEDDCLLLVLPPDQDPTSVLAALRKRHPQVRAGTATTPAGAADWAMTFELATRALEAARALGVSVGDASDPVVGAEMAVARATEAAAALVRQLPGSALRRLEDHDHRTGSDLLRTVEVWCSSGFDVARAAGALHVHVNTLRYRLRRAGEISGLDLSLSRQRLAAQLLTAR